MTLAEILAVVLLVSGNVLFFKLLQLLDPEPPAVQPLPRPAAEAEPPLRRAA